MNKSTKTWLITAAFLLVIGLIIFSSVMAFYNWDFNKLSTIQFETNTYMVNDVFKDISINSDTADILFVPSEDAACKVVCFEELKSKHSVIVKNGKLSIDNIQEKKWYEHIGITFTSPKITVHIPQGEYEALVIKSSTGDTEIPKDFKFKTIDISQSTGDVRNYADALQKIKIKTSTGNIRMENISSSKIELSTSTGKTDIRNANCYTLTSYADTGSLYLSNVIATEKFAIERDTGSVNLNGCDAAEISIKTDTGDISGTLLSDKVFITNSDTGKIDVPKSINGGKCELYTDTGNIKISISE